MQDQNSRRFCPRCQRNVFPERPRPNLISVVISIIIFPIGIGYLIYYFSQAKTRCAICQFETQPINYNFPPFRGTPESYDPSLLPSGKVITTAEDILKPEGDFVAFIPDSPTDPQTAFDSADPLPEGRKIVKFCMNCGEKLNNDVKFCSSCGKPQ